MRQLALQFEVVPRFPKRAANDLKFKRFVRFSGGRSTRIEVLADQVQADDRQRLLEPTSLPKVLRGAAQVRRPQTAIISYAAQAAYARRLAGETADVDSIAHKFFLERDRKLSRLAHKLMMR